MADAAEDDGLMCAARVLIVEDDPQILRALIPALAVSGHSVCAVRTAKEAMREVAQPKWDAIVLDLGLPDADGADMIEPLSRLGLPVIVITARDEPGEQERALARGAAAFLQKPFPAPELVRLVETFAETT